MMFFLLLFSLFAQSPKTVYQNNEAIGLLGEEGRSFEAKQILQEQVIEHPDLGELKYNYGQVFEKSNDADDAIREYLGAAKNSKDGGLQFQAFFNAARLYGEKKEIPNALKYYQLALDLKPDSIETKTNIELLMKSGGGGGGGKDNQKQDSNNQQDKKEGEGDPKKDQPQPQGQKPQQQPKKQPQKFKSQELSEQDVRRILDELKRQEDGIRKKLNDQKPQESPIGKDW